MADNDKFQPKFERKKEIVKTLPIIILFENAEIIITTTPDHFEFVMQEWLTEHPHLRDDKQLMDLILSKVPDNNIINCPVVCKEARLTSRLEFRLASFLEKGSCYIFSKKAMEYIDNLEVETYSDQHAPMIGSGGRQFFLPKRPFFETEDWTS